MKKETNKVTDNRKEKVVVKKEENKKKKQYAVKNKTLKKEKVKRENVFKRIGKYFKGVFKEIRRVRWTSGKDLLRYSIAAVSFVIFFGLYFYAIDWIVLLIRSLAK